MQKCFISYNSDFFVISQRQKYEEKSKFFFFNKVYLEWNSLFFQTFDVLLIDCRSFLLINLPILRNSNLRTLFMQKESNTVEAA